VTVLAQVFLATGAGLMLLSAIGTLRLPDVFARAHAATKSASLGLGCVLVGTALADPTLGNALKVLLAILFQFATAPVAAHVIGRAAYRGGVALWEGTLVDEFGERPPDAPGGAARGWDAEEVERLFGRGKRWGRRRDAR
jgi:multicomponent Na+:H+ antiporter subunit G